jgi:hypothetical protein
MPRQKRIFGKVFKVATPEGRANNVDAGPEEDSDIFSNALASQSYPDFLE